MTAIAQPATTETPREDAQCAHERAAFYIKRQDDMTAIIHRLRGAGQITEEEALLLCSAAEGEWDDAIHIAAPWDRRVSLCGNWGRNLAALTEERPDGMAGCWTCLHTADWLTENSAK